MSPAPMAISATELKRAMFTIPGMDEPGGLNDGDLEIIIARKTALGLHALGVTTLPDAGTVKRSQLDDAVHRLAFNDTRRLMQPDNAELLRELNADDNDMLRSLEALKDQNPTRRSAWGGGVVGG